MPKPAVHLVRHDLESALEGALFSEFRDEFNIGKVTSPAYDHDLNPIAESTIRVISELDIPEEDRASCSVCWSCRTPRSAPAGRWATTDPSAHQLSLSSCASTGKCASMPQHA